MIVVDTSVWIDYIRGIPTALDDLLGKGRIAIHPFVTGELLLNGLPKSSKISLDLGDLPSAKVASPEEVAAFIGWAKLAGTGVGYVDVSLLLSAKLLPDGSVLTHDRNLHAQAERLGLAYQD